MLAAVECLIVAAKVCTAKGVAIRPVGSERGVVAGCVVELAVTLGMMTEAVIGVAGSILRPCAEALVVGAFDQRRRAGVGCGCVVRMRSAACGQKTRCSEERQCKGRELHGVLSIQFARTMIGRAFEEINAAQREMLWREMLLRREPISSRRFALARWECARQTPYSRVLS